MVAGVAVAVIIGAAFGKIVTSLTENIIMPMIGWAFGSLDFSKYFVLLGAVPAEYNGSATDYAALIEQQAVIDALAATNVEGITGSYTFNETNDPVKSAAMIQLQGGEEKFTELY